MSIESSTITLADEQAKRIVRNPPDILYLTTPTGGQLLSDDCNESYKNIRKMEKAITEHRPKILQLFSTPKDDDTANRQRSALDGLLGELYKEYRLFFTHISKCSSDFKETITSQLEVDYQMPERIWHYGILPCLEALPEGLPQHTTNLQFIKKFKAFLEELKSIAPFYEPHFSGHLSKLDKNLPNQKVAHGTGSIN